MAAPTEIELHVARAIFNCPHSAAMGHSGTLHTAVEVARAAIAAYQPAEPIVAMCEHGVHLYLATARAVYRLSDGVAGKPKWERLDFVEGESAK